MVANCCNSAKSPSERETYVSHFEGSEGLKTVRPMFVSLSVPLFQVVSHVTGV